MYIYLSTTPEALIASMLPPKGFGAYYSTGTKKMNKGQAIFFEVDLSQIENLIDMDSLNRRCVAKPDGSLKSSVYLSVYKVLEMIPLSALKSLYLTTDNGHTLELKKAPYHATSEIESKMHVYQELCPVTPLIASNLLPFEFMKRLTDGSTPIVLPKLFFVELGIGDLASNPMKGSVDYLPFTNVSHLRDCLEILSNEREKQMKTVNRVFSGSLLYRTIESGFYVGSKDETIFYPFPGIEELRTINYEFFRSI
jgi:hypothetical protein